jgi:metal-responsive CopG/Arc/MetJ family transcriptional regulator
MGHDCGVGSTVETIQVVIDAKLLQASDRAARKAKLNRSLIRLALREHLQRLETIESEERDRRGYEKHPEPTEEFSWETEAAWPRE